MGQGIGRIGDEERTHMSDFEAAKSELKPRAEDVASPAAGNRVIHGLDDGLARGHHQGHV